MPKKKADELKPKEEPQSDNSLEYLFKHTADPGLAPLFSNRMLAIVQDSNVLIYFGNDRPGPTWKNELHYESCISMTHAYFMQAMEYLVYRYDMLREMYDYPNKPIGLNMVKELDPERHQRAVDILMNAGRENKEGDDNGSAGDS